MSNSPVRPAWSDYLASRLADTGGWRSWVWLTLYPLAWVLLSEASSAYWFLPAGLRLAVLWQASTRAWVPLALLEGVGVLGHHLLYAGAPDLTGLLASNGLAWLATAAAVLACRPRLHGLGSLGSELPMLLGAAFLASLAGAGLAEGAAALGARPALGGSTFLGLAQSSFTGMLVLAPLLLALLEVRQRGHGWPPFFARGQVLLPGLALLLASRLPFDHSVPLPLALCLGVLFWLALRQGWRASALSMVGVLLAVNTSPELVEAWKPARMQLLIAAAGAGALLLGASTDAMRLQGRALQLGLTQLGRRSDELVDATKRLVTVQEHERRTLGSELHDVLGQDITAIATRLRLVERTATDPQLRAGLHSIRTLVDEAHLHLREVVEHMYPVSLDRFGLARTLCEGPLAALARDGGLAFSCEVPENLPPLHEDVATSLYRICQEVTSNCVRNRACRSMRISLKVEHEATHPLLVLATYDDAGPLDLGDSPRGMGLQTIRDRANALGALYQFDPQDGEPRHWLSLSLSPAETDPLRPA